MTQGEHETARAPDCTSLALEGALLTCSNGAFDSVTADPGVANTITFPRFCYARRQSTFVSLSAQCSFKSTFPSLPTFCDSATAAAKSLRGKVLPAHTSNRWNSRSADQLFCISGIIAGRRFTQSRSSPIAERHLSTCMPSRMATYTPCPLPFVPRSFVWSSWTVLLTVDASTD